MGAGLLSSNALNCRRSAREICVACEAGASLQGVHSLTVVSTRLDFKLSDVVSVVHAADFPSGS